MLLEGEHHRNVVINLEALQGVWVPAAALAAQ